MQFNFSPFPVLITQRVILRQATNMDLEEILFLRSDKQVNQFVKRPLSKKKEDAEKFIARVTLGIKNNENLYWAITQKGNDKMIGSISLWNFSEDKKTGEVGYDLHPEFQNIGIMSEVLKRILQFGFEELKLNKIKAYTQYNNKSSVQLLLRNNFKFIENKKDEDNEMNIIFEINN